MLPKQLLPYTFYATCCLLQVMAGCGSTLPDRVTVLREGAQGSGILQVTDADGRTTAKESERMVEHAVGDADDEEQLKRIAQVEQAVTGGPLVGNNRVQLLVDGPATYESMFDAMSKAKNHIHLETYILADDEVGHQLADLLLERRAAGVEVKIIYDSLGSIDSSLEYFEKLRAGGVQIYEFHPPVDPRIWLINQRDHRKLLITDGKIAFTGGMNISGVYSSSSSSNAASDKAKKKAQAKQGDLDNGWRDTHVRVEGPAVAEFQKLFLRTWAESGEPTSPNTVNFPPLDKAGQDLVRVIASTGGDNEYDIYKAYLAAISLARERIWVTQAYFSPDDQFIATLKEAARRGVDVRILLPGFSDSRIVFYGSRSHYTELLAAGVKLYERTDAFVHAKTAVVDGMWSTVGSSNLDYRSFLHNNEVNAVILGRNFGRQMEALFQLDQQQAKAITLTEWERRPLWERLNERFSTLFEYWI
ncbi:MAG: cardiolipin synthase [Gammaproteobacteria bacterium]